MGESEQRVRVFLADWLIAFAWGLRGGYKVVDADGQSLAYVYARETRADADTSKVPRRMASNIAKLPTLLSKKT